MWGIKMFGNVSQEDIERTDWDAAFFLSSGLQAIGYHLYLGETKKSPLKETFGGLNLPGH